MRRWYAGGVGKSERACHRAVRRTAVEMARKRAAAPTPAAATAVVSNAGGGAELPGRSVRGGTSCVIARVWFESILTHLIGGSRIAIMRQDTRRYPT